MLSCFHPILERNRQTDGWIDGRTDFPIPRMSMLTRDKKLRCRYVAADYRQTRSIARLLCDS